ncbi:MAG: hypothetical protein PF447_07980 [Spirochaetaceae bacterium]|jgi:hypothetical protein|nr:hypothetical protein [Spirochaetaceae bacterium]
MEERNESLPLGSQPHYSMSLEELLLVLLKRIIALPSKAIGFKPLCLYAATYLLWNDKINQYIWFSVLVVVLFGIIGLKALKEWPGVRS